MELEFAELDKDCDALVKEIEEIVWGLSSLKMGTFGQEGLAESVVSVLENLKETCDNVLKDKD